MKDFSENMSERFLRLVIGIMKLETGLCKTFSGRHIYTQLFRSGTSAGANFEESRSGESKADFIHKMQIVLKELRESHYWIMLIINGALVPSQKDTLGLLLKESEELSKITAKSVSTAKVNAGKQSFKESGSADAHIPT